MSYEAKVLTIYGAILLILLFSAFTNAVLFVSLIGMISSGMFAYFIGVFAYTDSKHWTFPLFVIGFAYLIFHVVFLKGVLGL